MPERNDGPPNIWTAWHRRWAEPHCFVGHYNPETKLFWRELTKAEKERAPDKEIIEGTFAEMAQHTRVGKDNYHNARVMAFDRYQYSKKVDAPEDAQLGEEYGLRKLVIV